MHHARYPMLVLMVLLCATGRPDAADAQHIEPIGVLGNSGVAGRHLLRTELRPGRAGVHLDADMGVWMNGGNAVLHTSFDGRLITSYSLGPCARITSDAFTALDDSLYFIGTIQQQRKKHEAAAGLFRLSMRRGAAVSLVHRFETRPILAAQTYQSKLLLAPADVDAEASQGGPIYTLDPHTGEMSVLTRVPKARQFRGLAFDASQQTLYVGGYFQKYVPSRGHRSYARVEEVIKCDLSGNILDRRDFYRMNAIPSDFKGELWLAADALWSSAGYGFLGRMRESLRSAPGKVTAWNLTLGKSSQILSVRGTVGSHLLPPTTAARRYDPLLIATRLSEVLYAHWDREKRALELRTRIGSLPKVHALALGDNWISVGSDPHQLWWRWQDTGNAAPRFGNIVHAVAPGVMRNARLATFTERRGEIRCAWMSPSTSRRSAGRRGAPPFVPIGFTANPRTNIGYATGGALTEKKGSDAARDTTQLWCTRMNKRLWAPRHDHWQQVSIKGELHRPGKLTQLNDGRLLVVDRGAIVLLEPQRDADESGLDTTFRVAWRFKSWRANAQARLGQTLHLAGNGKHAVIADTDRHRLLWFDPETKTVLASFGETDVPGDDARRLHRPTHVAMNDHRAVVYDAANQRLIKCRLHSAGR